MDAEVILRNSIELLIEEGVRETYITETFKDKLLTFIQRELKTKNYENTISNYLSKVKKDYYSMGAKLFEERKCVYCNKGLREFKTRKDWETRKAHKACYKKFGFGWLK